MARWGDVDVSSRVGALVDAVADAQREVAAHSVYGQLRSLEDVQTFMEHHVFAVWDFMSLLTAMRLQLTCTSLPWRPVGTPSSRRFLNELVLAEESDERPDGLGHASHFELYLEAMAAVRADRGPITAFLDGVGDGQTIEHALAAAGAPAPSIRFVDLTWRVISSASLPRILGAFTFGRESLIPSMFTSVRTLAVDRPELGLFCDYLDRHIELDGDTHAPMAFKMLDDVCADDDSAWAEAQRGATEALEARIDLWRELEATLLAVGAPA